jgi:MFS transporter, DHA2 family, multidrug resistance protein
MTATAAEPPAPSASAPNRWLIAVVVTLAAFMEVLDTTIVNVSVPHIAGTMAASQDEATWVLTSYLVANGVVLTISGFLSRLFGRKRYFVICIVMFTICSFLCGVSQNLGEIIVFRLLQGFFGGGLQPNQQSIILDTFPPEQRSRAFSVTAVATIVAPVLGPTLGGWITDNYSWRWVFFINIPVGIVTVLAVLHLVRDPPWAKAAPRGTLQIDYVGLGLIALGLGCLQVMLDRGEDADWFGSSFIRVLAVLAACGIVGAIYWLLYSRRPIVDLNVFRDRNFAVGSLLLFAMATVLYASAVAIPLLTQQQLGYTALWAGLVLSPGAALLIAIIPVVNIAMRFVQARYVIGFGFLALGLSMLYSSTLSPQINFGTLAIMRGAQSAGIGLLFVPISTLAYLSIPRRLNADSTALFTMLRNLAGSIGISLSTAFVNSAQQANQANLAGFLSPYRQSYLTTLAQVTDTFAAQGMTASAAQQSALGWMYQTLMSQASVLAYLELFTVSAILSFLLIPLVFLFSPVKVSGGGAAH